MVPAREISNPVKGWLKWCALLGHVETAIGAISVTPCDWRRDAKEGGGGLVVSMRINSTRPSLRLWLDNANAQASNSQACRTFSYTYKDQVSIDVNGVIVVAACGRPYIYTGLNKEWHYRCGISRFGEFCYCCCCLPLLPQLACSILATWEWIKPNPVFLSRKMSSTNILSPSFVVFALHLILLESRKSGGQTGRLQLRSPPKISPHSNVWMSQSVRLVK